jgi:hypothetical protein
MTVVTVVNVDVGSSVGVLGAGTLADEDTAVGTQTSAGRVKLPLPLVLLPPDDEP